MIQLLLRDSFGCKNIDERYKNNFILLHQEEKRII